jgi:hypothetical protein
MKKPAGVLLLAAIVIALLYPFSFSGDSLMSEAVWTFLHFPAMAAATWAMGWVWPRARRDMATGLGVMVVAVPALELLQGGFGRDPALPDLLSGWMGVLAIAALMWIRGGSGWTAMLILLGIAASPVIAAALDRYDAQRDFPVLEDFRPSRSIRRWDIRHAHAGIVLRDDVSMLALALRGDGPYPGVFMRDVRGDWSGWKELWLDVELAGDQPLHGTLRIDDRRDPPYADRFQQAITLVPGFNHVVIDLDGLSTGSGRVMRLDQIYTWGFFFAPADAGRTLYVRRVGLGP